MCIFSISYRSVCALLLFSHSAPLDSNSFFFFFFLPIKKSKIKKKKILSPVKYRLKSRNLWFQHSEWWFSPWQCFGYETILSYKEHNEGGGKIALILRKINISLFNDHDFQKKRTLIAIESCCVLPISIYAGKGKNEEGVE